MKQQRDLLLVAVSMLFWGLGESLFLIFQPLYLEKLGATPVIIGTILGINSIGMGVFQIPLGFLGDRIGRREIMWAGWVLGVVATLIMGLAKDLPVFVVGLLFYGITAAVVATLNSYIAAARGSWSVGKAISFMLAAYNIGAFLGPVLGGALGQKLGLQTIYLIASGVFTISTLIIFFIHKQPIEPRPPKNDEPGLLNNTRFILALCLLLMVMFAMYLPYPLTSNFLQNERNLSLTQIGLLGTILSLASVGFMFTFGHISPMIIFVVGQVCVIGFSLILWKGDSMAWYIPAYILMGGMRLGGSARSALIRPLVNSHQVGLAFGISEATSHVAFILAPILAGLIYEKNPQDIYWISSLILAGSLLMTVLSIRIKSRIKGRILDRQPQ